MRKIFILLILITSTLYFACRKETAYSDTKNLKINDAKVWMNKFLETNQIDPMFKDIVYHWDKASNFVFKNGYSAITVPLTNNNQNPSYTGRRVLYLYPWKNGKGYYSTIFELIPESNHVKNNNGKIELKIFDGLIMTWDLKQGFVRGANFINGIPQKNIQVEYRKTRINDLHDSSQQTANTTTLPGVTVVGFIPSANWGFFFVSLMNSLGYSTSYLWNAGGGNPCEYSGCGYSENPSDYFDPNTLNEINNNLRDEQWLDENVKDSTNNPCATDVINKLSSISDKLPKLIRDFFSSDANFSMTIKMSDLGSGVGGNTVPNVSTNSFNVNLNSHFNNATDLAMATTIIHEAFHCQLMSWFREAVSNNDVTTKQQLAAAYGYLFSSEMISLDSSLAFIVNGGNATQHQDIVNRYKDIIADALYQFAQSKGISIDLNYCKDLAWSGTFDSKAFKDLPYSDQERILERVNAEKDPTGDKGVNTTDAEPKGHPCS